MTHMQMPRVTTTSPLLRRSKLRRRSCRNHRIASHWGDDFFGWAWECCALCKRVAAKLMLDKRRHIDVDDETLAAIAKGQSPTAVLDRPRSPPPSAYM